MNWPNKAELLLCSALCNQSLNRRCWNFILFVIKLTHAQIPLRGQSVIWTKMEKKVKLWNFEIFFLYIFNIWPFFLNVFMKPTISIIAQSCNEKAKWARRVTVFMYKLEHFCKAVFFFVFVFVIVWIGQIRQCCSDSVDE